MPDADELAQTLSNPIVNGPYDIPERYFEIGLRGPTGVIKDGRRPSESLIPIATARKGRGPVQTTIDFDLTGDRRERNELVNDLRREVARWRASDYDRATAISKKLLRHWADESRENRVLFCQREAAETAVFLAEVAGRHGYADWRRRLEGPNAEHNAGLPRVALKMATGAGKTVVMAMLIAWQTANKIQSPRDARFAKRFLVVTPGITILDRLRVLQPGSPGNYYDERDLVPADLQASVAQAQVVIVNYHQFQRKDAKEIRGVAANTRKLLRNGRADDQFRETPAAMVTRVLRAFAASTEQIVVLNDEAHHCYQGRSQLDAQLSRDEQAANADARLWFTGLLAVQHRLGIKAVYDLSATPFYLGGSGYHEGYIFPWVVSDFSLMDAIESGIVKIPRTPVDDDATGDLVTYLRLWDHIGTQLPKQKQLAGWIPPKELEGAIASLYRSYERSFEHWQRELAELGEPPPVFIVVCPNTVVSRLIHDYIAGTDDVVGALPLFRNRVEGRPLTRPRTILIDSAQLESGEAIKADFRQAAADEIELFKIELRQRNPGSDADSITDEDLLREVMNTVGKPGRLGGEIRCVVSVAMLTEGWDANTVTHILGVRAFGSQLLCEQVVGRGLRRRSYLVDPATGHFEPEYANVYGIPFAFIPSDRVTAEPLPRPPAVLVESLPERAHLRIEFPNLDGYRTEIPDQPLVFDPALAHRFVVGRSTVPTRTDVAGVVGVAEQITDDPSSFRHQQIAYALARRVLNGYLTTPGDDRRPWYFPQLVAICRTWLDTCVDVENGMSAGYLMSSIERQAEAAEAIGHAIVRLDAGRERLRPMLRSSQPTGSTAGVSFATRKAVEPTEKSEINVVTLDGIGGNTWEQLLAGACERDARVAAFVKNDHVGLVIPYVHAGRTHGYLPDFLVRLVQAPGDITRTLIVEVSGGQKSPGPTRAKADTARDRWCVAVNNHGSFGRWGYVEIRSMDGVRAQLATAIDLLYADAPIIGDPDLLDFADTARAAAS